MPPRFAPKPPRRGEGNREYEPRVPEATLLYRTVREELEHFLLRARERGQPAPPYVEHELRAYLRVLFAELRRRIRCELGTGADQCGAVTSVQHFGSAMNLNFPLLALLARTRIGTGPDAGQRWRRLGDRVEPSTGHSPDGEARAADRT